MDIPNELDDDFNRIYDTQHIPNILQVPGVNACTRYRLESSDVEGVARYTAVYDIDSPDLPGTDIWTEASDKGDWITQIRPYATNRSRSLIPRCWPRRCRYSIFMRAMSTPVGHSRLQPLQLMQSSMVSAIATG